MCNQIRIFERLKSVVKEAKAKLKKNKQTKKMKTQNKWNMRGIS